MISAIPIQAGRWSEYELLDCGAGRKLERFGPVRLVRPEPKAWWSRRLPDEEWRRADAVFQEDGRWSVRDPATPRQWELRWGPLTLLARLTDMSKHVGVFPEQDPHWRWLQETARARGPGGRALNLFGYTGVASLVLAQAGWSVTHVDASKPSIGWGRANQEASGLSQAPVRWILEDAFTFVKRELRRGHRYDLILLDPPSFGRGPHKQIWKVEEQLVELLHDCRRLWEEQPVGLLLTLYNLEASALMVANLLQDVCRGRPGSLEAGELALPQSGSERSLPLSLYGRWSPAPARPVEA